MRKNEKNYLTIITVGGNIDKLSEMRSEPFQSECEAKNFEKSFEKALTRLARCANMLNVRHSSNSGFERVAMNLENFIV